MRHRTARALHRLADRLSPRGVTICVIYKDGVEVSRSVKEGVARPTRHGPRVGDEEREKAWQEQLAREARNPTDCIECGVGDGAHAIGCYRAARVDP